MNFRKRMMAAMLVVMMQCSLCVASAVADEGSKGKQEEGKEVQILFTHDMHSHLDAYKAKRGTDCSNRWICKIKNHA